VQTSSPKFSPERKIPIKVVREPFHYVKTDTILYQSDVHKIKAIK